jgi:hypothetical protein
MKRFLSTAALVMLGLVVATPVQAGYLILRVILDGGGSGAPATGGGEPGGFGPGIGGIGGPPMGSGLGPPGGLQPGGMQPMGPGGTPGSGAPQHDPTRSLFVVVPFENDITVPTPFYKGIAQAGRNPAWRPKVILTHRGEKFVTNLYMDTTTIQLYEDLVNSPGPRTTRATEIAALHRQWSQKKSDPKLLFAVMRGALEVGLVDSALSYADELLAFAADKKTGLPPEVAAFAQAYGAMQKGLKSPAPNPSAAEDWRVQLSAKNIYNGPHYSLISWDATGSELQKWAGMLEENYKAFFLWHATQGIELPLPKSPLVAVLPQRGNDVMKLASVLDAPINLQTDGFYSSDHDLLVLSPERMDQMGQTLNRQVQQIYQAGVPRDRLLAGEGPAIDSAGVRGKKPDEVARMQTMALIERLIEDDAATSVISREASRQLLYATNRLPRHVELPEWVSNGSSNFFTRPKDPAFITNAENKMMVAVTVATGYGGPNYVLQRYLRDLDEKKELHPDRATLLKNVLTDAYFRGLRDPKNPSDPDPAKPGTTGIALSSGGKTIPGFGGGMGAGFPMGGGFAPTPPAGGGSLGPPAGGSSLGPPALGGAGSLGPPGGGLMGPGAQSPAPWTEDAATLLRKKRDRLSIKAQATSWALYYYLAKDRQNELRTFLDELAALPRDLPLEGETVTAAFCRAFNLDGSDEAYSRFANRWLEYVRTLPKSSEDILLVEPKPKSPPAGGFPGGPGFPGGGGGNNPETGR